MASTSITAVCPKGHRWSAQQEIKESALGGGLKKWERLVTPAKCPKCAARWVEANVNEKEE